MNVKSHLLTIFSVCFLVMSFSVAGQEKYYYGNNEKIYIRIVEDKVVISISSDSASEMKTILSSHPKSTSTEWKNDTICVLTTALTPKEMREYDFKMLKGIKSIQPVYMLDELELFITDEIMVSFHDDVESEMIERLHREHNVVVKKKNKALSTAFRSSRCRCFGDS